MTLLNKSITLNQQLRRSEKIWLKQGNKAAQTLLFTLLDGGAAIDLTSCAIMFFATKPSGATLANSCSIVSATAGKVAYVVTEQTSIEAGVLTDCYLQVIKTGIVLNTFNLDVEILASKNYDTAIATASEFTAFQTAMAGLTALQASAVHLAGAETITGLKSVPTPTADAHIAPKGYVDQNINFVKAGGLANAFTAMPYVGTAPIVASGDGYVKYADGTMLCWGKSLEGTTSNATGAVFYSEYLTLGYPAGFYASPKIIGSVEISNGIAFGVRFSAVAVGSAQALIIGALATNKGFIHWIAIGRWKA